MTRRGEDQRFEESRPAARRRRSIEEAMPERGEGETRADVARRLDGLDAPPVPAGGSSSGRKRPTGPMSYEIGGPDDPDAPRAGADR